VTAVCGLESSQAQVAKSRQLAGMDGRRFWGKNKNFGKQVVFIQQAGQTAPTSAPRISLEYLFITSNL
jgi:hypothetical protein